MKIDSNQIGYLMKSSLRHLLLMKWLRLNHYLQKSMLKCQWKEELDVLANLVVAMIGVVERRNHDLEQDAATIEVGIIGGEFYYRLIE